MPTQTVQNTINGDVPSLFSNWYVITETTYNTQYGDNYKILAVCSSKDLIGSHHFLDIITDTDYNYLTLGHTEFTKTLEIADRLSLMAEGDRTSTY